MFEVAETDAVVVQGDLTQGRILVDAGERGGGGVTRSVAVVALLLVAVAACRPKADSPDAIEAEDPKTGHTMTIYRTDEAGLQSDCGAVLAEEWVVPEPPPDDLPSAAIREVLRDISPNDVLHRPGTLPLADYFSGVHIRGGVAVLAFDADALEYLNNAACAQMAVKAPMVRTLLAYPGVSSVEFEIDGQIFRDWDA